jgi:hypothetical protein
VTSSSSTRLPSAPAHFRSVVLGTAMSQARVLASYVHAGTDT